MQYDMGNNRRNVREYCSAWYDGVRVAVVLLECEASSAAFLRIRTHLVTIDSITSNKNISLPCYPYSHMI